MNNNLLFGIGIIMAAIFGIYAAKKNLSESENDSANEDAYNVITSKGKMVIYIILMLFGLFLILKHF